MTKYTGTTTTTVIVRGPDETNKPGIYDVEFAGKDQRYEFCVTDFGWDVTEYDDQQQETRVGTATGKNIHAALVYYFGFDKLFHIGGDPTI